jgi:hypothetical protein
MRHGPQATIQQGTWLVGAQLAPGTYQATVTSGCYWERLRDFEGGLSSIIANSFVAEGGSQFVTIASGHVGFTSTAACGTWSPTTPRLMHSG